MIVLDTHAWIWWAAGSARLPAVARHTIDGAASVGVCAISLWEVAMLIAKRRLELDRDPLEWVKQALALPRVELVPFRRQSPSEPPGCRPRFLATRPIV